MHLLFLLSRFDVPSSEPSLLSRDEVEPVLVWPELKAAPQSGAIRSGVGGAKDRDQGECGPTKHVPDSEPDKRGTKCLLAYGSVVSSIPEVGAVCGKAARTDLCGGREVTRVPTATP